MFCKGKCKCNNLFGKFRQIVTRVTPAIRVTTSCCRRVTNFTVPDILRRLLSLQSRPLLRPANSLARCDAPQIRLHLCGRGPWRPLQNYRCLGARPRQNMFYARCKTLGSRIRCKKSGFDKDTSHRHRHHMK